MELNAKYFFWRISFSISFNHLTKAVLTPLLFHSPSLQSSLKLTVFIFTDLKMWKTTLWQLNLYGRGDKRARASCMTIFLAPSLAQCCWLVNTLLKTCLSMEPPSSSQGQPTAGTDCSQIKQKSGVFHQKVQFWEITQTFWYIWKIHGRSMMSPIVGYQLTSSSSAPSHQAMGPLLHWAFML